MKHTFKILLSLAAIAAVSFGVLWGGDTLTRALIEQQQTAEAAKVFGELLKADRFDPLSTDGFGEVNAAYRALNDGDATVGYGVTVTVQGYADAIVVHVALSADGSRVRGIRIGSHRETPGYGARIETEAFLRKFTDVALPVSLTGSATTLRDGTYRAVAQQADDSGFRDVVELAVKDGAIVSVNWDAVGADGVGKKELSRKGQYVMTEDGLPWHEQAQRMEEVLLRTQDPAVIVYDPQSGKTDAYSGASIRIDPFVKLAMQAVASAAGDTVQGTPIDGLSGATVSSKAVISAVNAAAQFVKKQGEG